MRLKQLFESSPEDLLVDFLEDCRPFLERCMGISGGNEAKFLFHGTNTLAPGLTKQRFKLRNAGRDTPKDVFDALNDATMDMFGEEPRRWMFVSSSKYVAHRYGNKTALIFPTGNDFKWFKIRGVMDLYADLDSDMYEAWEQLRRDMGGSELEDWSEFKISYARYYLDYRFDSGDFVLNNDFASLFKGDAELMIFGDEYYSVEADALKSIIEKSDDTGWSTRHQKMIDWLLEELKAI